MDLSAYELLLKAVTMIPSSHYIAVCLCVLVVFVYNILEFHFLEDLLTGFRGTPVSLTYNSSSHIYTAVASKCRILHSRYLATPWLSNPHFQTTFLCFLGRPPTFSYRRQLYVVSDDGTIALDWLMRTEVRDVAFHNNDSISRDDTTPIVVVIPGLTSDSADAYIKHLVFNIAKHGWNVVVCNHRGLGGISVTSDCFYNAGWTADLREVLNYLHLEYPKAPLFTIGTSIGANVLVKYLGEDGDNVPVAGAAAICSPWDLLIGARFIERKPIQKLYDRALTIGLQGYAKLHEPRYTRLANWEGIKKSRSIRDFDKYATCLVGKFETVDTYYRRCSSSSYVQNVSVPLLCINALDDPLCTTEAIPWDECRANKNIILATPKHGGHLAFFEGVTASRLWWVSAVKEFLSVLQASPFMHTQKKTRETEQHASSVESSIDQGPYVNVTDGMVAAAAMGTTTNDNDDGKVLATTTTQPLPPPPPPPPGPGEGEGEINEEAETSTTSKRGSDLKSGSHVDIAAAVSELGRYLHRHNRRSTWLLAYIAIMSTWPLLGTAIFSLFKNKKNKPRNILPPPPAAAAANKLHKT